MKKFLVIAGCLMIALVTSDDTRGEERPPSLPSEVVKAIKKAVEERPANITYNFEEQTITLDYYGIMQFIAGGEQRETDAYWRGLINGVEASDATLRAYTLLHDQKEGCKRVYE